MEMWTMFGDGIAAFRGARKEAVAYRKAYLRYWKKRNPLMFWSIQTCSSVRKSTLRSPLCQRIW
jgi:hypothetical protein